jgi:hypothetical protein
MRSGKITGMKQWVKDTAGLGVVFWLIGYLTSLVLFFTPYAGIMGWILAAIFTPVTIAITWWWFHQREVLSLQHYAGVGVAWMLIAVVLDYLFIVLLFQATYYGPDVFLYYAVTFLIPVGVGLFMRRTRNGPMPKPG